MNPSRPPSRQPRSSCLSGSSGDGCASTSPEVGSGSRCGGWRSSRLTNGARGNFAVAAHDAATAIQHELQRVDAALDRLRAIMLDGARHLYLLALYELDERRWRLAKDVERDVAPDGQPLAICLGAWGGSAVRTKEGTGSRTMVEVVDYLGRFRRRQLGGYGGCLKTFPDAPYSRGNCWPCWCDVCEKSKSNAKAAAITALRRWERLPPR